MPCFICSKDRLSRHEKKVSRIQRNQKGSKLQQSSFEDIERTTYNARIARFRKKEYSMIHGTTYLDHAGTTLPSKSLVTRFADAMQNKLLANPHSSSLSTPNYSYTMIEQTRIKVLQLFQADPEEFEVIFVANATAAIRLVADAFSCRRGGFDYLYHRNSHTSLVGVRELSKTSHCFQSDQAAELWLRSDKSNTEKTTTNKPTLFAYPAQSNMNGRRLPSTWPSIIRSNPLHHNTYTLLDVAALVSTSPLDLSDASVAPDFVSCSFYKMFGFPDVGALVVRKSSSHVFDHRRYFGGGTTEMITCDTDHWVAKKPRLCNRLEDGTLPIRNILALNIAIDVHQELFGGFGQISKHTGWLAKSLYDRLGQIRHWNGEPVCCIYADPSSTYGDPSTQGATVTFNVRKSDGDWIGSATVGRLAVERNILIRTGSLCNPAGMANALGLTPQNIRDAYDSGFRCNQADDIRTGVPMGMVRASLGPMSTMKDVDIFVGFIEKCFAESQSLPERRSLDTPSAEGRGSAQSDRFSAEKLNVVSSKGRRKIHAALRYHFS